MEKRNLFVSGKAVVAAKGSEDLLLSLIHI